MTLKFRVAQNHIKTRQVGRGNEQDDVLLLKIPFIFPDIAMSSGKAKYAPGILSQDNRKVTESSSFWTS